MAKHLLHGTTLDLMADVSVAALTVGRAEGTGMERDGGHQLLPKSTIENVDSTEMPLPIFEGQRQGASNTIVSPDGSPHTALVPHGLALTEHHTAQVPPFPPYAIISARSPPH